MNGLLKPEKGRVLFRGKDLSELDIVEHRRNLGFAIQGSGLFPHMKVIDNLSIIAKRLKWTSKRIKDRAEELMNLVNLDPALTLKKYPRQLSGGQQQRVGIARAIFCTPQMLLMDEAFGALDPITRKEVQNEFLRLHEKLGFTAVIVTHDLSEAFKLGSRICLLNHGRVEQTGSPNRLLLKPETEYAKSFIKDHSPGQVLEDVSLYSVINNDLYYATKNSDGSFNLKYMSDSDYSENAISYEKMVEIHNKHGQSYIYFTDHQNQFMELFDINANSKVSNSEYQKLRTDQSFLKGLNSLIESKYPVVPIVNKSGELKGVFSEEAISAL